MSEKKSKQYSNTNPTYLLEDAANYLKAKGAARVSENVAYGYRSPEEVVSAWLKSESHKEAIEGDFTHSGLSVVKNEKGIAFFTQIFIKK